ncbi:MAG: toxin-antitoxin system HicB family antitoxin [Chloroflexi bacterium]|nr:toxin-antitoxin system HicB family antitoxin [Chloroflexota bacterium]
MKEFIPDEIEKRALAELRAAIASNDTEQLATLEEHRAREASGRLVLRMPKVLHERLQKEAKHEGVSLNQYIVYKLASK